MVIRNPFYLKTMNNFNSSLSFWLDDIFNYLIYHSTDYDKQELAAYKSFNKYRLLSDGYVESLQTAQLNQKCFYVYIAKVPKQMKESSTTISGLFLRAEVQTEAVNSRQDVRVKGVEMGDVSTLWLPLLITHGPCIWVKRVRANTQES